MLLVLSSPRQGLASARLRARSLGSSKNPRGTHNAINGTSRNRFLARFFIFFFQHPQRPLPFAARQQRFQPGLDAHRTKFLTETVIFTPFLEGQTRGRQWASGPGTPWHGPGPGKRRLKEPVLRWLRGYCLVPRRVDTFSASSYTRLERCLFPRPRRPACRVCSMRVRPEAT